MLRPEPCATPSAIDSTSAGLQYASTSFDATMPMTPRCQASPDDHEHVVAADVGIAVDDAPGVGDDGGFLRLTPRVLFGQETGQRLRVVARALIASLHQQQIERHVGRAHAAGGVQPRRQDEAHVKAVERLAQQSALCEQRFEAGAVRPLESAARPQCAMTRFSPTSGTTSASVPIAATLRKCGSNSGPRPLADISAWTSFSATPTPARPFSG